MIEILHKVWASQTMNDIIAGLYSSGIFLILLSLLKPRIEISEKICYNEKAPTNTGDTLPLCIFKIVNKSYLFRIYDIQVGVWKTTDRPSFNGVNKTYEKIELRKNFQWVINRKNIKHFWQDLFIGDKRIESRTDYAAQFSTKEDLRNVIDNNGTSITIEVIAKHSLTGFSRVVKKTYKHSENIEEGHFYSGNSCKVKLHRK